MSLFVSTISTFVLDRGVSSSQLGTRVRAFEDKFGLAGQEFEIFYYECIAETFYQYFLQSSVGRVLGSCLSGESLKLKVPQEYFCLVRARKKSRPVIRDK